LQFGTNHLGHFALTGLLLPALVAGSAARVVTLSSSVHRTGRIRFDDPNWHDGYQRWAAYGQSKLANLLFTFELQRRSVAAGLPLIATAAHPGYTSTKLRVRGPQMDGSVSGERLMRLARLVVGQDAARGALPTVAAAVLPDARGGDYWGPGGRFQVRGLPARLPASSTATDATAARRLWELSEQLTGVTFDALSPAG